MIHIKNICNVLLLYFISQTYSYTPHHITKLDLNPISSTNTNNNLSRRKIFKSTIITSISILTTAKIPTIEANAIDACRAKFNCIRTKWTPPPPSSSSSMTTKASAIKTIREVLNTYPLTGQNNIDCNGWKMAVDRLDDDNYSYARLEYQSCVGVAAVSINFGRPFVDDLVLEMGTDGSVEVKSSSRMGSSDLGVNKKRVEFLGEALRRRGWSVPPVDYGRS